MGVKDVVSAILGSTGPERRAWLDRQDEKLTGMLNYYLGPAAAPVNALASLGAAVSPGADFADAYQYGAETMAADGPMGALTGLGMTGASMLGMALPGRVSQVDDATDTVLRLLREGRGAEVTEEMRAAVDPAQLYAGYDLPVDEASRMARARDMGFRPNMPIYHGTDETLTAFDPAEAAKRSDNPAARQAIWAALDPEVASQFPLGRAETGRQVLDLVHRADRPARAVLDGTEGNRDVAATLGNAFNNGYDALLFDGYRAVTPEGQDTTQILAMRDPRNIRSRFALFDPRLAHLRNLSAGVMGGYFGLNALMPQDERE